MIIEIVKMVLLAGILLYVSAMATALNAIASHNLKFDPAAAEAAVAAVQQVGLLPGETVQVQIGAESFKAQLIRKDVDKHEIELSPIRVGDLHHFELAKDALRAV